jgi:hypothetical protein
MAAVRVNGGEAHHLAVASGPRQVEHRVFLGQLPPGKHTLTVSRAEGVELTASDARVRTLDPNRLEDLAVLHAPVLYPRPNTLGKWSDVPLFSYATTGKENGNRWFEYTVVFSNEDGGTSSRNLMARWGRAADIEYLYKVWLDGSGRRVKTLIQTRDHDDIAYEGAWVGDHPSLAVITQNNMVEAAPPGAPSPIRYRLAPVLLDLAGGSRELAMDLQPWSYRVVADELKREGKLRPPMTVDGEKIADPRGYLVVEFRAKHRTSALQALVRLKGRREWHSSSAGLPENFINRGGYARVAIELPPGTTGAQVEELGFQCMLWRDPRTRSGPSSGECSVEALGKIFLPRADGEPGPPLRTEFAPMLLRTGDLRTVGLRTVGVQ